MKTQIENFVKGNKTVILVSLVVLALFGMATGWGGTPTIQEAIPEINEELMENGYGNMAFTEIVINESGNECYNFVVGDYEAIIVLEVLDNDEVNNLTVVALDTNTTADIFMIVEDALDMDFGDTDIYFEDGLVAETSFDLKSELNNF